MRSYLERILPLSALAILVSTQVSTAAMTSEEDPSKIDLAKLIECTTYDVPSYNGFAMWLTGPESDEAMRRFGITEQPSTSLLLREFKLAKPITVFGRQTDRIAFASSGPLALINEADPHPLAKELGVTAAVDRFDKYLAEREIFSKKEQLENSDTVLHSRIALDVSTDIYHPGKTLAGCSYSIEVE
ncbi:hypothetical protein ACXHXG_06115 [Rhizobium sp. LEGMi198b]|uniref:hypothetical protein n=1 Tax=unclassified Rhizobium TaxID=2613769 RepID=UPI000CDF36DF|nr:MULTISPECIES: hypothetical protein [Rhizobium]AVA19945.1 hypothetical protein NXC24_CH00270 [Rhizobium sp. NXC24]MDK4740934.1 hypothetical protein [Rhizobium sp. CNPSo 3464]UWU21257.1 hypothetical protein N2601_18795 [Rhizobium tropici]WFU02060.1 hypothetical protein QA648_18500 [Rhizobium sp. CB3171]